MAIGVVGAVLGSKLLPVAVTGAIELIKLGVEVLHTWQSNPEDQAAVDAKWEAMQTRFEALKADWRSRHPKTGTSDGS